MTSENGGEDAAITAGQRMLMILPEYGLRALCECRSGLGRSRLQRTTTTGLISCDAGEHWLVSLRAGNASTVEDRSGVVAVIISERCVDVKQDLWQVVQSHPVQERVCLDSTVDCTTNGMVNRVVESGTVWIAFALGGIVVKDYVRCYMG